MTMYTIVIICHGGLSNHLNIVLLTCNSYLMNNELHVSTNKQIISMSFIYVNFHGISHFPLINRMSPRH